MRAFCLTFMVLSIIVLVCDIFPNENISKILVLNNWLYNSVNVIEKISFSETRKSTQGVSRFSSFGVASQAESLSPDQIFSLFDSLGDSWLVEHSTNELEHIIDKLTFLLNLQLKKHSELLSELNMNCENQDELVKLIENSEIFLKRILGYLLILFKKLIEKKQTKFELDSIQIKASNTFNEFQLLQRDLFFNKELRDLLRSFFFFFNCNGSIINNSPLCAFIFNLFSETEHKLSSLSKLVSEAYEKMENEWEDILEEGSSTSKHRKIKKKKRTNKYKYKPKSKNIRIRKKTGNKSKRKIKTESKV